MPIVRARRSSLNHRFHVLLGMVPAAEEAQSTSDFKAATRRFRPIVLTALTTFFGLAPMIFEQSVQARFLIPMAISLGYGILFTTAVILLLTPALYVIHQDIRHLFK